MKLLPASARQKALPRAPLGALGVLLLALAASAAADQGAVAAASVTGDANKTTDSVTLEQCTAAATQMERAATFAAEMTLVPGSTRMEMRIQLLERRPNASVYRSVTAPGLGAWRAASAGVKVYRYVKQVTNLAAPASYRAEVHFRWLGAHGRVVKSASRRSSACAQLLPKETGATEAAPASENTSLTPLA